MDGAGGGEDAEEAGDFWPAGKSLVVGTKWREQHCDTTHSVSLIAEREGRRGEGVEGGKQGRGAGGRGEGCWEGGVLGGLIDMMASRSRVGLEIKTSHIHPGMKGIDMMR